MLFAVDYARLVQAYTTFRELALRSYSGDVIMTDDIFTRFDVGRILRFGRC
jgi:hypothetical protein